MQLYKVVMNGVSKSFPVLLGGSFLLALLQVPWLIVFIPNNLHLVLSEIAYFSINSFTMILCAQIAQSIAGDAALTGGYLIGAAVMFTKGGVIGSLVGGILVGYSLVYLKRASIQSQLMIVIVMPLFTIVLMTYVYLWILCGWVNSLNYFISNSITMLAPWMKFVGGAILGIFMVVDLGGPINKVNCLLLNMLYLLGHPVSMAIKMGSGIVAPMGIGLVQVLKKNKQGWSIMGLGALFVTESIIDLNQKEPKNVKLASILGAGFTGGAVAYFSIELLAVHGGLIMALTVRNPLEYLLILLMGIFITSLSYLVISKINPVTTNYPQEAFSLEEYMEEI